MRRPLQRLVRRRSFYEGDGLRGRIRSKIEAISQTRRAEAIRKDGTPVIRSTSTTDASTHHTCPHRLSEARAGAISIAT